MTKLGIHSMLAVPIYLHRFSKDVDTEGVLQIYYKKEDKVFTPLEVEIAEMFSKRVGYVVALKKINYLHKLNVTKDKILEHIYQKLARGEGIKMKDLFDSVIPELVGHHEDPEVFPLLRDGRSAACRFGGWVSGDTNMELERSVL